MFALYTSSTTIDYRLFCAFHSHTIESISELSSPAPTFILDYNFRIFTHLPLLPFFLITSNSPSVLAIHSTRFFDILHRERTFIMDGIDAESGVRVYSALKSWKIENIIDQTRNYWISHRRIAFHYKTFSWQKIQYSDIPSHSIVPDKLIEPSSSKMTIKCFNTKILIVLIYHSFAYRFLSSFGVIHSCFISSSLMTHIFHVIKRLVASRKENENALTRT